MDAIIATAIVSLAIGLWLGSTVAMFSMAHKEQTQENTMPARLNWLQRRTCKNHLWSTHPSGQVFCYFCGKVKK